MLTLSKFASRRGRGGEPLPSTFPVFDFRYVRFRYGSVTMIAGRPGSFKSVLALNLLVRWARDGKTGVYFAADSDETTTAKRCAAILTGRHQLEQVEPDLLAGRHLDRYADALRVLDNVRFEYNTHLDLDGIEQRLGLFELAYGDYPDLVFVDNLINFAEHPQDWAGMGAILIALNQMALDMRTHICVLHHASEAGGEASDPVKSKDIMGKLTQIPRLSLTTAANGQQVAVCCVKNTNGPMDPEAKNPMLFTVKSSLEIEDDYEREMTR